MVPQQRNPANQHGREIVEVDVFRQSACRSRRRRVGIRRVRQVDNPEEDEAALLVTER
jgi:hypothetical protein